MWSAYNQLTMEKSGLRIITKDFKYVSMHMENPREE